MHLLQLHEPGNELHVVPEISIPGGSVDYFLASVKNNRVKDFVGIELQTLDTTGTVWPERERFLHSVISEADQQAIQSKKTFGMNWKMTAKTTLVQLHHKIDTFEHLNKKLVLVIQNYLLEYMRTEFSFSHLSDVRLGDSLHIHAYEFNGDSKLNLVTRKSTDSAGVATCLGLQASANVELQRLIEVLEQKISDATRFIPLG